MLSVYDEGWSVRLTFTVNGIGTMLSQLFVSHDLSGATTAPAEDRCRCWGAPSCGVHEVVGTSVQFLRRTYLLRIKPVAKAGDQFLAP